VENAVLLAERWILARLRNRQFFSLHELNCAIRELLVELNAKDFQKLPGCRKRLFESLDRPALLPLPAAAYQFAEWKKARVNIDYHIEVDRHYYSVPYQLIHKQIDVRFTQSVVECFYKNNRVASHVRSFLPGRHTTVREHMPEKHRKWIDWTPQRFIRWAEKIGPNTRELIEKVLADRPHPQQGFRSSLGILRLSKSYSPERMEGACRKALAIGGTNYRSVESILKHNLDTAPPNIQEDPGSVTHENIRGAGYYN
jgi:transposase